MKELFFYVYTTLVVVMIVVTWIMTFRPESLDSAFNRCLFKTVVALYFLAVAMSFFITRE